MFDPEAVIFISILMLNVLFFEYLVELRVSSSLKLLSGHFFPLESQILGNLLLRQDPNANNKSYIL